MFHWFHRGTPRTSEKKTRGMLRSAIEFHSDGSPFFPLIRRIVFTYMCIEESEEEASGGQQ